MTYSLNAMKDDFFKNTDGCVDKPLFPLWSTPRGMGQIDFLNCFFPRESFLGLVSENVFFGTGTSASQRSNLFNRALPKSRAKSLRINILKYFSNSVWNEMLLLTGKALADGTTEEASKWLDSHLNHIIEELAEIVSYGQREELIEKPLLEKTAVAVLLVLMNSLYATSEDMHYVLDVIFNRDMNQGVFSVVNIGNTKYLEFGHYPQTVASSKTHRILQTIEPQEGVYYYKDEKYIKWKSSLHTDFNMFGDDFVFSDGTPIQNNCEYFFRIEPIRWKILNETESQYFVLADKILDHVLFNTSISRTTFYFSGKFLANSWEGSYLFNWLNRNQEGCFIHEAFDAEEQKQIKETVVSNAAPWKEYDDTCQRVFPLSYDEAVMYLLHYSDSEKKVQAVKFANNDVDLKPCLNAMAFMTDFAICRGVCPCNFGSYLQYFEHYSYFVPSAADMPTNETILSELIAQGRIQSGEILKTGTWWLRSPGNPAARFKNFDEQNDYTRRVCDIMEDGHLCERGSNVDGGLFERGRRPESCDGTRNGVRPALYLKKY